MQGNMEIYTNLDCHRIKFLRLYKNRREFDSSQSKYFKV